MGSDGPSHHALLAFPSAFQPQGSTSADFHANISQVRLVNSRVFCPMAETAVWQQLTLQCIERKISR